MALESSRTQHRWSSEYGFSRSMRIPEIQGAVALQTEYLCQKDKMECERQVQDRGSLTLHMSLVAGEEVEDASQDELIESVRALFLRVFTSRNLTARQISRFVAQCEHWEAELKRSSPMVLASIVDNLSRDAGLRCKLTCAAHEICVLSSLFSVLPDKCSRTQNF